MKSAVCQIHPENLQYQTIHWKNLIPATIIFQRRYGSPSPFSASPALLTQTLIFTEEINTEC